MKAAIIGCGNIHGFHAEGIKKSGFAELAAVADIDAGRSGASAARYGCDFYTDYREVLKNPEIDAVHICTPHYLHAPMAIDAMRMGKHVLVEKPMAISSSDAVEMTKVSRETGKQICVCFQNRYNATSLKIKEMLDSGQLGTATGARAFVTWNRGAAYYAGGAWRGTWKEEGGGVLINQAIHTLDLLQWFLGDIAGIKGSYDTKLLKDVIEVEDTAEAVIKFKSGAVALFYATNCYVTDSPILLEVICEKAKLTLEEKLTITYKDGSTEVVTENDKATGEKAYWGCGHEALIRDFYDSLIKGRELFVDGTRGITALRMIEGIYRSVKTGEYESV